MTPQELQLEAYKILVSMLQKDDELYWKRNDILIAINTGLLTVAGILQITKPISDPSLLNVIPIGLCFIGVVVCTFWFFIGLRGEAFYNHWYEHLKYLERTYLEPIKIFRSADTFFKDGKINFDESNNAKGFTLNWFVKSARIFKSMLILSGVFALVWIGLLAYILILQNSGCCKC
jgi:hypothetical protein